MPPLNLVTGGTGLVGSALVRQLVIAGEPVRVLRRATSPLELLGMAGDYVEHALGDVTDPEAVRDAMVGVGRVYHAAALLNFSGGRRDEERLFEVNVEGTAHVVDAAREAGVERLVHVSSIAALGRPATPGDLIDEETPWADSSMNTGYAKSKRSAEWEVQRGVAEGLDAVMVNPSLVFGRGRPGEGTMRAVERAHRGGLWMAAPGGTSVVDVQDVALGMRAAMEKGRTGERYILTAENLPFSMLFATLSAAFGQPPPRVVLSPRALLAVGTVAGALGRLTFTTPKLTREQARIASTTYRYSHRKAVEELGLTFRPFRETAERIARELGA